VAFRPLMLTSALATVWISIALSYRTNWPLGFFVRVAGAVFFLLGQSARAWALAGRARRRRGGLVPQGVEHDRVIKMHSHNAARP
jgi:hypothetical protein